MKKIFPIIIFILLFATACQKPSEVKANPNEEKIIQKSKLKQEQIIKMKTPTTITFNAVGDISFGTQLGKPVAFESIFREKGSIHFIENFNKYFQNADFNMANLENVFTDSTKYQSGKVFNFKAYSKDYISILNDSNIKYVNVINNHMHDYLQQGFDDNLKLLEENKINYFGTNLMDSHSSELGNIQTDTVQTFQKDDFKIGMLGFFAFYNTYPTDEVIKERVDKLRADGCDFIVANMHGGGQGKVPVDSQQINIGHRLIDNGVDLVIGHHPHTLQNVEIYKDKKIYYSLGNFLFLYVNATKNPETIIVNVTLTKTEDGIDAVYKNIPFYFTGTTNQNTFKPTEVTDKNVIQKIENILGEKCY